MKLIDRFAHFAQLLAQLLFLLSLRGDLNQWNHAERENRQHGDRDDQLDQSEPTRGRRQKAVGSRQKNTLVTSGAPCRLPSAFCLLPSSVHRFTVNLTGSI